MVKRSWMRTALALVCLISSVTGEVVVAQEAPRLAVAPVDEILVLDSRTDPEGKPSPVFVTDAAGQPQLDIPPTLIVHRHYYTGDRDFRGPAFPGGPSTVVVNHPFAQERLYLDVDMPAGSPRVTYRQHSISYNFGNDCVEIRFADPILGLGKRSNPTIKYTRGTPASLEAGASTNSRIPGAGLLERSGIPDAFAATGRGVSRLANGTADAVRTTGETIGGGTAALLRATPLNRLVDEPIEDNAAAVRNRAVERAARLKEDRDRFISTNR